VKHEHTAKMKFSLDGKQTKLKMYRKQCMD